MSTNTPRVLLLISGSIAAYKAPELCRALVGGGAEVRVAMTARAREFVTPLSLAAVSGHPVRSELLDPREEGEIGHIELARWADLVLVAPATADILARAAVGRADDVVTAILLATRAPVVFAPAMNSDMWAHPATRHNVALLRARGGLFIGPEEGELACRTVGPGRLVEPEVLAQEVLSLARSRATTSPESPWKGRRVLVTTGPTRSYLDAVRFVTNGSTGEMGCQVAEALLARGAEVTLVAGPTVRSTSPRIGRVDVETAEHMYAALRSRLEGDAVDAVVMAAAVSDLRLATPSRQKLPKRELAAHLEGARFEPEIDVLATLCREFGAKVSFVGFAAQVVDDEEDVEAALLAYGSSKLETKGCDAIFVNRVGAPGVGFGSPTHTGYLLVRRPGRSPSCKGFGAPRSKAEVAAFLVDETAELVRAPVGG